jgi:hypothetical protein
MPTSSERTPSPKKIVEPIWFEWMTLAGLFIFSAWLLGVKGVWHLLLTSDPTGITAVIILVFVLSTLWSGIRARELAAQRAIIEAAQKGQWPSASQADTWAAEYWQMLMLNSNDGSAALDVLMEKTHGIHATAWWINGVQLKLGLLGKVIGFSMLAMQIGQIQNFDPAQSQELLRSLTMGLGVALLTTMVGLVGNILLGLQLTRLDRFADDIVTQAQRMGWQLQMMRAES